MEAGSVQSSFFCKNSSTGGTSLVVQWLRVCLPNVGSGSIPGQRTRSLMLQLRVPMRQLTISHAKANTSVQFSHSVVSDSLGPCGLQHARPPCPSPTPGVYSNSCLLSRWCHPTVSSSVFPFSSRLQSFPASGSFPVSEFFASWLVFLEVWGLLSAFRRYSVEFVSHARWIFDVFVHRRSSSLSLVPLPLKVQYF